MRDPSWQLRTGAAQRKKAATTALVVATRAAVDRCGPGHVHSPLSLEVHGTCRTQPYGDRSRTGQGMRQALVVRKGGGVPVEAMSYEEIEATILRSMDALGTKPEDYAEMIQRCLAKKGTATSGMWGVFQGLEAGCAREWESGRRHESLTI